MKMTRKIIFAILIGLSLFAAASAISTATHASAATAIEYG
jgi:ABC-type glycerol-3-phosphate transport system substrate-binding protein